jgi:hypothetical protein
MVWRSVPQSSKVDSGDTPAIPGLVMYKTIFDPWSSFPCFHFLDLLVNVNISPAFSLSL